MKKHLIYLLISVLFVTTASGQADIKVTNGSLEVISGATTFDFGNVIIDYPITNIFIVENVGDADLTLDASNSLIIGGTDVTSFATAADLSSKVIAPNGKVAFDVAFSPFSSGLKNGTITITSDDPDENSFTFNITGTAVSTPPECTILASDFESFQNGSATQIDFGTGDIVNSHAYSSPSGWQPVISQVFALFGLGTINVTETADARSGAKALELFSDGNGSGDILTVFKCSTPYTSLKGYYKFAGSIDDTVAISISTGGGDEANRNDNNTNTLVIDADALTYTQFDLPIKYDGLFADSLFISISLSNLGSASSFKLDDLEFGVATGTTVPSKPSKPTFTATTSNSATVNWTAAFDFGSPITSYTLEQKEGVGGTYATAYSGTDLTFSVSGLTPGTSYFYRVKATNAIGDSDFSDEAELIPDNVLVMSDGSVSTCNAKFVDSGNSGNYGDSEDFTLTISPDVAGDKVSISFNSFAVENGFDDLKVYDGPNVASTLVATLTGSSLPADITATESGGELTFRFTSDGSENDAGWDADLTCVTGSVPSAPAKPSKPTFTAITDNSATVNWVAPFDSGSPITGYTLEQKEGAGGTFSVIYTGTDLTFGVSSLTTGTSYFYRVKATNAVGDSEYSDETELVPQDILVMSNGSVSTCNKKFVDSGNSGNYADNEDFTLTISPDVVGNKVSISFNSFAVENGFDDLKVYDGPNVASTLVATLTGSSLPADITATESGGELTFRFTSDGSETDAGWDADLTCVSTSIIWSGSAWSNVTGPTLADNVEINGDYNTSTNGNISSKDLTISSAINVTVENGGHIEVNGDLDHNGASFTVKSGGSLVTKGNVTGTNFTFERTTTFDENTGRYSIVGSPISGADFSNLGSNAIIYGYDETQAYNVSGNEGLDRFKTPATLGHGTMQVGSGYFSARTGDANGLITFAGTPNNGTQNVSFSITDHPSNEDVFEGFNLVSNPYPCAIDYTIFIAGNNNDIESAIYLWDDFDSETTRGTNADYVVINAVGNVDSRQSGLSNWDGHIRSMQGFFVQAKGTGDLQLDFTDAMKVTANNDDAGYYRTTNEQMSFKLVLESSEGSYAETLIGMRDDASLEKDQFDARLFSPAKTTIYSQISGEAYAIQGMPRMNAFEVPLGIKAELSGTYEISIDELENLEGYNIILKDHLLNIATEISSGNSYRFSSNEQVSNNRFSVVASNEVTNIKELVIEDLIVFQNESLNLIIRTAKDQEIRFAELISLTGQSQRLELTQLNSNEWQTNQVIKSGLFMIRVSTDRSEPIQKIILK